MDGVLVIDKPAGPTSHDVVARVRRVIGIRRVGHTGTLDPGATGVLPLVMGRATRLARFLSGDDKVYEARIRLGYETDTYDAAGRARPHAGSPAPSTPASMTTLETTASRRRPLPERAELEAALDGFRGSFLQAPPPFSAKKVDGVRAYRLARKRRPVSPRPVRVTVRSLELESAREDELSVRLVCSSGFYVRSLAHDLGRRLGCGGHLVALRRIKSGDFGLDRALPLADIASDGRLAVEAHIPLEELLPSIPVMVLNARGARRAAHGNSLSVSDVEGPWPLGPLTQAPGPPTPLTTRVFDPAGSLLAIGECLPATQILRPIVVLV